MVGADSRDNTGATILVIDDEAAVGRVLQRTLEREGYRVPETVTRPEQLAGALDRVRPELVLLDINLGEGGSGLELATRLPAGLPVVFCSAHSDRETLERAGALFPGGFVVKPIDRRQLAATLAMALASRRPKPAVQADPPGLASLSAREREIVQQLLSHKRAPAIASSLFISQHTVRNHLKKIFAKLNVRSQQELLDVLTRAPGRAPGAKDEGSPTSR